MTEVPVQQIRDELDEIRRQTILSTADRIWKLAARIATALAVPAIVALAAWLTGLSDRVAVNGGRIQIIEATRFRGEDGRAMEARIMAAIAAAYPPEWLRLATARLERGVEANGDKIDSLRERVARIESKLEEKKED